MIFLVIGSTGCYKMQYLEENEAVSIVKSLMENAEEINRIHYGAGLEREIGNEGESYARVIDSEKYKSLKDIEEFTRSVLSDRYATDILNQTCKGMNARYIEVGSLNEKVLLAKKEMTQILEIYTYDLSSIKIEQATKLEINATIERSDGKMKKINIISEYIEGESVWRIDSPTY